jgi:hypothetical protein
MGQTISVNHRDLKAFIPKSLSDAEDKKLESSKDLELSELKDTKTQDAEAKIEEVTLVTDFLEWSSNPKFLLQA